MFSKIGESILKRRWRNSPTREESEDEAIQQYLGKQAKLETALDASVVDDMRRIAETERNQVEEYKARVLKLEGNGKLRRGKVGDFIVCDDYRKGSPLVTVVGMVLALVALTVIVVVALYFFRPSTPEAPPAQVVQTQDKDTTRRIEIEKFIPELGE